MRRTTYAVWRWLKTLRLRARTLQAMRAAHPDPYLDATRVLRVDPTTVRLMAVFGAAAYTPERGFGHVIDGDWDLASRVNVEQRYYRIVSEVISKGILWRDTETGREARAVIEAGGTWMGIDDMEILEERYRLHDELLRSMRASGFYTQRQLRVHRPPSFKESLVDEILVGVGRDGRILLIDGRHRFAIACLLGFEEVPVQVGVRHPGWMAFRRDVAAFARAHGGTVPQPLLHADLDNVPAADDCGAVFEAVLAALPQHGGAVLDVGSLWGYHAHRLEDAGFDCVAFEERAEHRCFLERLRVACDRRFQIEGAWPPQSPPAAGGFAAALALERFEPADARSRLDRLVALLRQAPVATLYVRLPAASGSRRAPGRQPMDESWLDRLTIETGFGAAETVAEVTGGPILRLAR
jgi:hypothetical protein